MTPVEVAALEMYRTTDAVVAALKVRGEASQELDAFLDAASHLDTVVMDAMEVKR